MTVTAAEQYLLELINRARLDPEAEAERYNLALNAGLAAGTITSEAREVLAPNFLLEQSAQDHSDWMIANDTFAHEGDGGTSPGERIANAGYVFEGAWSWRENLAWSGTTGSLDLVAAVETHHEGLYRSAGHRENTFATDIREAGVAQVEGTFVDDAIPFNASVLTLNFARSGTAHFLTGVAYDDVNGDAFYGVGEGVGGITISTAAGDATTAAAGGYGITIAAGAWVAVTVSQGAATLATLDVDLTAGNVKLDLMYGTSGAPYLALSGSAALQSGIPDAVLLGVADLDLTGSAADNTLTGNAGSNVLRGAAGDDALHGGAGEDALLGGAGDDLLDGGAGRTVTWASRDSAAQPMETQADDLSGGAGNDQLLGGSGRDRLDGGAGDDVLEGGSGRDTFIFNGGNDVIVDFDDNVDQITIDRAALGLSDETVAEVLAMGRIEDRGVVFAFGDGDSLEISDLTSLDALENDIVLL